jgi:hypothetical protein
VPIRKAVHLSRDVCVRIGVVVSSVLVIGCLSVVSAGQTSPSSGSAKPATTSSTPSKAESLPPDQVILKVGDRQITKAQFEQYIADLEAQQGPADLSRKQLGNNYASILMLSQQALDNHLEDSPTVIRQLAVDRTQILSNAEFAKLKEQATPTAAQMSEYYNAHLQDYDVVELRRVFIWKQSAVNPKGISPADVQPLAQAIRQAYASGNDPKKLIKDPDTVVLDAAPLKFQRGGEMPPDMEKVAFAMSKPGEWAELANREDALILIQLVSRSRRSLKDVSEQIEKKLENEKLREQLDAMKKQTGIWMDEGYFASRAPIPVPSTEPEASGQSKSENERGER